MARKWAPQLGNLYFLFLGGLFINFKERSNFLSHLRLGSDPGDQISGASSDAHTLPSAFLDAEVSAALFSLLQIASLWFTSDKKYWTERQKRDKNSSVTEMLFPTGKSWKFYSAFSKWNMKSYVFCKPLILLHNISNWIRAIYLYLFWNDNSNFSF